MHYNLHDIIVAFYMFLKWKIDFPFKTASKVLKILDWYSIIQNLYFFSYNHVTKQIIIEDDLKQGILRTYLSPYKKKCIKTLKKGLLK